jgi:hypothetical protein
MNFVFERTAEGRVIKNLTVVDDATHEAVAIVPERAMGGLHLTRVLDQLTKTHGLPKAIRTDNVRQGILQPSNVNLGIRPWRSALPHSAGQAQSEHLYRILEQAFPG